MWRWKALGWCKCYLASRVGGDGARDEGQWEGQVARVERCWRLMTWKERGVP